MSLIGDEIKELRRMVKQLTAGKITNEDVRAKLNIYKETHKRARLILDVYTACNSPHLIEEMDSFVIKMSTTGGRKVEHASNCHDDRIIALFIALSVAHESEAYVQAEERIKALEQRHTPQENVVQFQTMGISWKEAQQKWEDSLAEG